MRLQDATRKVFQAAGARWRFYPRIILGSSSDGRRIVFILAEAIQWFSAEILNSEFRARCSIWWGLRLTLVAPRIVNDVSCETRINHEIHFAWQAQFLVKLEGDACCSAHCKWRFICEEDQSWDWFFVAGAVFGEVGVSLFVAGAAIREILGDSRSAKCCFSIQNASPRCDEKGLPSGGCEMTILSSDYPRIILGWSPNRLYIGGSNSESFRWNLELEISWQEQYLVKL